ncbi:hypothetical protein CC1G_04156 [Coprinopsis cinerea okayama7|uniref:Uncharacterized protein n=1 Tax=Coprinopsis cinerea (strain Okayama-7 / 130 / ATCC MYA-4618 / FGSC 9003) TaxID=240176 RepID=A8NW68_COPC7|nr:hypothetical protein CC1G_04156 [Coprinopsis cinerea okayama7\|eukprot:XP_001836843.2 hypothetical protein CC1G_04156 [Coprinopsis cinerea okayama7\
MNDPALKKTTIRITGRQLVALLQQLGAKIETPTDAGPPESIERVKEEPDRTMGTGSGTPDSYPDIREWTEDTIQSIGDALHHQREWKTEFSDEEPEPDMGDANSPTTMIGPMTELGKRLRSFPAEHHVEPPCNQENVAPPQQDVDWKKMVFVCAFCKGNNVVRSAAETWETAAKYLQGFPPGAVRYQTFAEETEARREFGRALREEDVILLA